MSKLAIAYTMKCKNKKKMADGGPVLDGAQTAQDSMRKAFHYAKGGQIKDNYQSPGNPHSIGSKIHEKASGYMDHEDNDVKHNMSAMHEDDMGFNQKPVHPHDSLKDDLVERIMKKMSPDYSAEARLSQGGMVANDDEIEADFMPAQFDDLALRDDLEFHYDGKNSGDELGNEQEDKDRHDIVSRIMASRKKKDKNPRPA